jgi:hypothetical protein
MRCSVAVLMLVTVLCRHEPGPRLGSFSALAWLSPLCPLSSLFGERRKRALVDALEQLLGLSEGRTLFLG